MRKSFGFRAFFIAISAIWLFMMALLIQRNLPSRTEPVREICYAGEDSAEWMSIYLSGNKIGYTMSITRETDTGYQAIESSYMRFGLLGTDQDVKTFVRAQCDRNYAVESFSFEIRSKHQSLRAEGKVVGNSMEVKLISQGEIQSLEFDLPEGTYLPFSVAPLIEQKKLKEGDSIAITVFDPSAFQPTKMWIKHLGSQQIKHRGEFLETTHMALTFFGTRMEMWADDNGKVLRQEGPMGLLIVEEPRELAQKLPNAERQVELLTLFSIPTEKLIADPRSVTYLKIEVEGVELDPEKISNNRQHIVSTSPLQIEITTVQPEAETEQIPEHLETYLGSEPLVQVDHPRIKATSDSIVKGQTDPLEKWHAVVDWVYDNLEKSPTVSVPSAVDVLATKRGDCNEHAVLLAALLRSAGIPTTIATGVVYLAGSFYYHAWNRVYVGEWIDVDATFGQHIADATHLMLAEGGIENQASIANLLGKLNIKIVDYE
ncbi:transglutaminase domain-containing protein [candidate division TA06 bacterium]|uniref:Transglutaminase domain-containing protein n=1 Tax=candidate division TA06 bacterium TaxID=2250710 RepID=A0A523XU82_UNCT6|nr:MAG: transglutaminase domain-containing protein [candidate division TA06 bacterium]